MDNGRTYADLEPSRREIRLLYLLPGSWEEPLCCDLQVVSLNDQPKYQGLSYAWGKSGIVKTIQLGGKPYDVTENLWAALRRLRMANHARIIWADAICINQQDLEERSSQVTLMGEIYSSSSEVFIWLGDSISENDNSLEPSPGPLEDGKDIEWLRENIDQVINCSPFSTKESETLAALGTLHVLALEGHWTSKAPFVSDNEGRYHVSENYMLAWQATLKLLQLSWWSRIWVVQELVLAKKATLVVGSVSAPWELISDFCHSYLKHLPPGACCHASVTWQMSTDLWDDIVRMRLTFLSFFTFRNGMPKAKSEHPSSSFWEYLWLLRHKQATDPRDKVYGLLGLLHHCQQPFLIPDYSISTAETYSRCTEALIRSGNSLSALIGPRLRKPGMPTWVIDFLPDDYSTSVVFFHNLFSRISASVIFNACGAQRLRISLQSGRLSLWGVPIDRVKHTATVWPAWETGLAADTFRSWEDLACVNVAHKDSAYPSGCSRAGAFWRTMIRDTIRVYTDGGRLRRAASTDETSYAHFRRWLTKELDSTNTDATGDPDFANLRKSFFIATQHQHFFTTDKGYIGLSDVPQDNDEIWILFGGSVPFILRPYPDDSHHAGSHALVGDCYVHGIMDGEAVERSGQIQSRELCLV